MRYIVVSFPPDGAGTASIIDGIDEEYAADQRGVEGAEIYVVAEDQARVFRKQVECKLNEVPASELQQQRAAAINRDA